MSQVVHDFADWLKYCLAEITRQDFEQVESKLSMSTHPRCTRHSYWRHGAPWRQADYTPLPEAELNSFKQKRVCIIEVFLKAVAKSESNRVL